MEGALGHLQVILHDICDVYELAGRRVMVELDVVDDASWFAPVFDVLKEHSGDSTAIRIEAYCGRHEEIAQTMVKSLCDQCGFQLAIFMEPSELSRKSWKEKRESMADTNTSTATYADFLQQTFKE